MNAKTVLLLLFFSTAFWLAADPPPSSGVLVPYQSGSLGKEQRVLQDQLQQHQREQQKYRETVSGTGEKSPALKLHQETRERQERRTEIQRKELQESASPQTTLHRTLDDQLREQRKNTLPVSAAPGNPQHYERKRQSHKLLLHGENDWSFDQRTIGRAGLQEKLNILSQDRPQPKLEIVFGTDVSPERRKEVLKRLQGMGFSEISVLEDVPPKPAMPKLSTEPPKENYHWWQPEWWVRSK